MHRLTFTAALAVLFVSATPCEAQSPAFEVASVKLSSSGGNRALVQALPGRLVMENFALRTLIQFAYGMQDYQVLGGPSWIGSDHYDIEAKAEGDESVKQMEGPMLQALLKNRFQLVVHRETRQLPVYNLMVAKGGAKLESAKEGGCTPYVIDAPPPRPAAPGGPRPTFCGHPRFGVDGMSRTLDGAGATIADLAVSLARSELHRTVVDKTGLTGMFDFHLKWTVEAPNGAAGSSVPGDPGAALPAADLSGPYLFSALQEQLGLKLESGKGAVEVLVIDRVERPSAN